MARADLCKGDLVWTALPECSFYFFDDCVQPKNVLQQDYLVQNMLAKSTCNRHLFAVLHTLMKQGTRGNMIRIRSRTLQNCLASGSFSQAVKDRSRLNALHGNPAIYANTCQRQKMHAGKKTSLKWSALFAYSSVGAVNMSSNSLTVQSQNPTKKLVH